MCRTLRFTKRQTVAFIVFILAAGMAIVFYITIRPARDRLTVWTSTENEVDVRIEVIKRPSGQLSLSGTFTPTRRQFYLYGKDLPKDGLNGLGRPTLLEVLKSDSIKVTGPLTADQPVQDVYVNALDLSFPVYPIGPVTLSLPFERTGNGGSVSMEISITYMACSDKTCLPPVIDKHISIQAPASFFDDQR